MTTFLPVASHLLPTRSLLTSLPTPGADSDRRRAVRLTTVVSVRHVSAALGGRHIPSVERRWTSRLSARVTCCCGDRSRTPGVWLCTPLMFRSSASPVCGHWPKSSRTADRAAGLFAPLQRARSGRRRSLDPRTGRACLHSVIWSRKLPFDHDHHEQNQGYCK